jgi:hypothetical protein
LSKIFTMQQTTAYLKGRGAQINPPNPFDQLIYDTDPAINLDADEQLRTEFIEVHPKTMLNKVNSPDIPLDWSLNPYQGCEHGCVYCYARNTHTYWGYSAGTDFEQKILIKKNAAELVEAKIKNPQLESSAAHAIRQYGLLSTHRAKTGNNPVHFGCFMEIPASGRDYYQKQPDFA